MNLRKAISKEYIELLEKKGVIIEDRELAEDEVDVFFHDIAFNKYDLTPKQQEIICDFICDYEEN